MTHPYREELAGRTMHRHEMTMAELADCCEANAAAMLPASNLRDLLEHAAAALRQSPSVEEVAEIIRDKVRIRRSVEWDVASPLEVANAPEAAQAIDRLYRGSKE